MTTDELRHKVISILASEPHATVVPNFSEKVYALLTLLTDRYEAGKREGALKVWKLAGSPKCENLHHSNANMHGISVPCPVEAKIDQLIQAYEKGTV